MPEASTQSSSDARHKKVSEYLFPLIAKGSEMPPTQSKLWEDEREEALFGNMYPPSEEPSVPGEPEPQQAEDPCSDSSSSPSSCAS